jgi:hypothetical protein
MESYVFELATEMQQEGFVTINGFWSIIKFWDRKYLLGNRAFKGTVTDSIPYCLGPAKTVQLETTPTVTTKIASQQMASNEAVIYS